MKLQLQAYERKQTTTVFSIVTLNLTMIKMHCGMCLLYKYQSSTKLNVLNDFTVFHCFDRV